MSKIVMRTLCGISLAALVVCSMCSCSMDPPKNGVQIKVANKLSTDEVEALKKALKACDSGITSTGHMTMNGATTINMSPVTDIKAFSAKITFGTIKSTNGNVITLDVDTTKLGLPAMEVPEVDPKKVPVKKTQ
jgi:hypothetical protein